MRLDKINFQKADLTNSYFNKTSLKDIDLTTCDISGIDVEINDLFGVVVTAIQGLELTRLMNIIIK